MSKEKEEDKVGIVPQNEYIPELEKEVEYYYSIAEKPSFISKKRYTANKYPEKFKDKREEQEYQMEEINRIRYGYDGLCGKGYGFLNYAKLRDPQKGKISPEFRVKQEEYFRKIEHYQQNPGKGMVGFKRRRWGFTSIGAWDDWHDCATKPFYQIGANSKSESDSRKAFKHVKFIHQNVPDWLRPRATASDRRDFMEFGWYEKDPAGNRIKKGLQSWISVVAPVPQNHEGEAYSKLRIDEAGKIDCLLDIWAYGEDCLRLNTQRVGLPVILGTVGDIDRDGKGLMELYLNNEAYDLDRFAVMGYHGLIIDEFGNDRIKDAIRWIVYERYKRREATRKVREAFLQKYPLCDKDAFNYVSDGGVGNIQLINDQIVKIISNPPEKRVGWMRRRPDGGVDFVPNNESGKIIVYELPDKNKKYEAGADPADHDDVKKSRDSSNLALAIASAPHGLEPTKLVLEYVDRPDRLDKFFEQSAMALEWYNRTKVLIEDNRGRMVDYFKNHYPHLLPLVPKGIATAKPGYEMRHSVKMTSERKEQMMGLMETYIDDSCAFIPSIRLLEEHKVFGDEHADDDLAIAWGWTLVMIQAFHSKFKRKDAPPPEERSHLERIGNRMVLVNGQGKPLIKSTLPKNPLFRTF